MGKSRTLFVYFRLFYTTQIKYKLIKSLMECLGLEPGAAGWKKLSYGGTPCLCYHPTVRAGSKTECWNYGQILNFFCNFPYKQ